MVLDGDVIAVGGEQDADNRAIAVFGLRSRSLTIFYHLEIRRFIVLELKAVAVETGRAIPTEPPPLWVTQPELRPLARQLTQAAQWDVDVLDAPTVGVFFAARELEGQIRAVLAAGRPVITIDELEALPVTTVVTDSDGADLGPQPHRGVVRAVPSRDRDRPGRFWWPTGRSP